MGKIYNNLKIHKFYFDYHIDKNSSTEQIEKELSDVLRNILILLFCSSTGLRSIIAKISQTIFGKLLVYAATMCWKNEVPGHVRIDHFNENSSAYLAHYHIIRYLLFLSFDMIYYSCVKRAPLNQGRD